MYTQRLRLFTAAFFTVAKNWKQPEFPSRDKCNLQYVCTMGYYSAAQRMNSWCSQCEWISKHWAQGTKSGAKKKVPILWFRLYRALEKANSSFRNQMSGCQGKRVGGEKWMQSGPRKFGGDDENVLYLNCAFPIRASWQAAELRAFPALPLQISGRDQIPRQTNSQLTSEGQMFCKTGQWPTEKAGKPTRLSLGSSVASASQVETMHLLDEKGEAPFQDLLGLRRVGDNLSLSKKKFSPTLELFSPEHLGMGVGVRGCSRGERERTGKQMSHCSEVAARWALTILNPRKDGGREGTLRLPHSHLAT